jgi:enoyl-CoA hydratase/carnithine racemase
MTLSHAASSTTSPPLVLEERDGAVAVLTLNHSARRNVLSSALLAQLLARLESVAADRGVRCLILAANGPVFSAGHDLASPYFRSVPA